MLGKGTIRKNIHSNKKRKKKKRLMGWIESIPLFGVCKYSMAIETFSIFNISFYKQIIIKRWHDKR